MPRINAATSPLILDLDRYWRALSSGGRLMQRSELDPAEIKHLLPNLMLTEFHFQPLRLHYRLVGTEIVRACGFDFTGRWLHELDFASIGGEDWMAYYEEMLARAIPEPIYGRTNETLKTGQQLPFEWALYPLAGHSGRIGFCLSIEDHEHLRHVHAGDIIPSRIKDADI